MDKYKSTLMNVVGDNFSDMTDPVWQTLTPLITTGVLEDAHASGQLYAAAFKQQGLTPILRPLKTIERVELKAKNTRPDVPFKVNSDLCAFRFETYSINEISSILQTVSDIVTVEHQGRFFIRNPIQDTSNNEFTDIIQYAFAYVPEFGYISEIQAGHPFAMYTFNRDSMLRDMRNASLSTDGIVDLWDNDFYDHVKNYILGKSTKTIDELYKLWPGGETISMDDDLKFILSNL